MRALSCVINMITSFECTFFVGKIKQVVISIFRNEERRNIIIWITKLCAWFCICSMWIKNTWSRSNDSKCRYAFLLMIFSWLLLDIRYFDYVVDNFKNPAKTMVCTTIPIRWSGNTINWNLDIRMHLSR